MKKNILIICLIFFTFSCDLFFLPPKNNIIVNKNVINKNKIIFVRTLSYLADYESNIYIMNSDGTNLLKITDNYLNHKYTMPSLSPDGNEILYMLNGYIYTRNLETTSTIRLTDRSPEEYDLYPSYSSDGSKIIFVRRFESLSSGDFFQDIYIMNSDGTNLSKITDAEEELLLYSDPSLSPDGNKILHTINDDIYTMNIDGSEIQQLTDRSLKEYDLYPSYSSDGSKIIFVRRFESLSSGDFFQDIYIMNSDGTNLSKITDAEEELLLYSNPSLSSEGNKILYTINSDIYTMNIDGSEIQQLTDTVSLKTGSYYNCSDNDPSFF